MTEKEQFKFRVEPHLRERLERCAARAGFSSAQQFVLVALDLHAETLADYIIKLRKMEASMVKVQREGLLSSLDQESDKRRRK